MSIELSQYFDEDALLDRLTDGLKASEKQVVFIVGAPLTASADDDYPGVLDVEGITNLVRQHFEGTSQQKKLDAHLRESSNKYQDAFDFLKGRRGPDIAERIVQRAVLNAHSSFDFPTSSKTFEIPNEAALSEFETQLNGWHLSPGVKALGEIVALNPDRFGSRLITSNFDPLIEVAINTANGECWRTRHFVDGDPLSSHAQGCQVIHIHGYWIGSDCLHTGRQLTQNRPNLRNSLLEILKDKIVVVMAYGGWPDIFTETLRNLVQNSAEFPEIIWTFFQDVPSNNDHIVSLLQPGLDRNRVSFYRGIDCHKFLPRLAAYWSLDANSSACEQNSTDDYAIPVESLPALELPKLDSDRPPNIEYWVGRSEEMDIIQNTSAKVVAVTGLGGQGKSVLAAKYLERVSSGETDYVHVDWRDCKEQGDRIRTQICSIIERLSRGELAAASVSEASEEDLIEILISLSQQVPTVMVLDNVDHYVDFGENRYHGILDKLVERFARSDTQSRLIITCRPSIRYDLTSFESIALTGLSLEQTIDLYEKRNGVGKIAAAVVKDVWEYTDGHAFWNDLIAAQVARRPNTTLEGIFEDIKTGRRDSPDILSTIWGHLPDREQLILQVLSEVVRPETSETIQSMVSSQLRYNKFHKAMKSLTAANLIVVKRENNAADLFDLHPLVRQFVRTNFARSVRIGFIQIVLNQYAVIISGLGQLMGVHLPQTLLERFSQKAELEIEAGLVEEAFETLSSSESALVGSGNVEEYIRVAKLLFYRVNWETHSTDIKKFDSVLSAYIECLGLHQRQDEASELLDRFKSVVPENTARFIGYCNTKCHFEWINGNFEEAIKWGQRGVDLKADSNVDTSHDCGHNLALAERDGGDPSKAMSSFLKQYSLENLVDPNNDEAKEDGPALGNIGRCLQMLGQHQEALVCLKKSARAVENDNGRTRATNRAWARQWIGETLALTGAADLAFAFFRDGARIVESTCPSRSDALLEKASKLDTEENMEALSESDFEARVQAWIRAT